MKKYLLEIALTLGALTAGVGITLALVGVDSLEPAKYPAGFTFETICTEHGSHTATVLGNNLVTIYDVEVHGNIMQASEEVIDSFLIMTEQ